MRAKDVLIAQMFGGGSGGGGGGGSDWKDPTDGNTHLFINFPDGTPSNRLFFELSFDSGVPIHVDWGDGTVEDITRTGTTRHTYEAAGTYDISLSAAQEYRFASSNFGSNAYARTRLIGAWYDATNGRPTNIVLSSGNNRIKRVHICKGAGLLVDNLFGCPIEVLEFEEGETSFNAASLVNIYTLTKLVFPSTMASLSGSQAFSNLYGMSEYHFKQTTPPSVPASIFNNIPTDCKIYVPTASVDAYKAATTWSSYASKIVGE